MAKRSNNRGSKRKDPSNVSGGNNKSTHNSQTSNGVSDKSSGESAESTQGESSSQSGGTVSKLTHNDPAWYLLFNDLARDTASIPFNKIFGTGVRTVPNGIDLSTSVKTDYDARHGIPGLASLHICPSYGYANNNMNDSLTVAANNLYSYVRVAASGRKNYDPIDLLLYVLTMADLYSLTYWLIRNYNYCFTYAADNIYFYDNLLKPNHIADPTLIQRELANYRAFINEWIAKISIWAVPIMPILARRIFMFSGLYIENNYGNIKDQMYQYVPDYFYKFGLDSGNMGCLTLVQVPSFSNLTSIQNFCNSLIENIYGDEDFGIMSADIVRAFGDNRFKLAPIDEIGVCAPVYDYHVLLQMKNATIVPNMVNSANTYKKDYDSDLNRDFECGGIYQSITGNAITQFITAGSYDLATNTTKEARMAYIKAFLDKIITTENPKPMYDEILEITRLTVGYSTDTSKRLVLHPGSDICIGVDVSHASTSDNGLSSVALYKMTNCIVDVDSVNYINYMRWCVSHFKYIPIIYAYQESTTGGVTSNTRLDIVGNVENYTTVGEEVIERLHAVALLSLFYVPGVARVV